MEPIPALSVVGVSKAFPTPEGGDVQALAEVSIEVAEGSFTVLLGPSGCGKTTLLRCIAGLESPDSGQILLRGERIDHVPVWQRRVNTVFQSYALFPHMTVEQNIAFGLQMDKVAKDQIPSRVERVLDLVRMTGLGRRKPSQLSGGQQQRVALARALAKEPAVLLLDEPLSALDLKLRRGMQSELKRLQRETSITFVLVTHDQGEAMAMGDQVAVFNEGRIVQLGTPEDVYLRPRTAFVADFIGEANLIPARFAQGLVSVEGLQGLEPSNQADLVGTPEGEVVIAVRPENIRLQAEADGPAVVTEVTFTGGDIHVEVELGPTVLTVRLPSHGEAAPEVGARVRPTFLEGSVRIMAQT